MIKIGGKYIVEARFKKRVSQVEFFEDSNGKEILYDTVWRNGEFLIEPLSEHEVEYIQKFVALPENSFEEFDLNGFEESEMRGTFDACADDFRGDITDEIKESIESSGLTVYEYLTENGWDHNDTEYYINGAIDIEPK
tara:strand:- start:119 stop:532 length:414 start_codon:yes stop_codon:yes gene_type:complete